MLMEAEKLAAQAKKAYEKVKRQKAKEALKNELNMAEHKRSPRKAHPAPSVAMLKEAEKLSNQAFKLSEKAKKQEAKELVAAATADAKETAAYATQVEKELGKAVRAAEKAATKLGDHTLGDYCLDDVRMLRATQLARSMVEKMVPPQTAEQWQEKFDAVCKACGELLDVTPAVARMAYIDPAAFDAWKVHEKRFNTWVTVTTGEGVLQDFVQAVAWYRKAANQGDADAQFNLGESYRNGQGVSQDYAQAAAWYRKAAEQGDSLAQVNLGVLYDHGQGVRKDYKQAAAWYRKAAEQGNPRAQSNLSESYIKGQGVRKSYGDAYFWLSLAAPEMKGKERRAAERALEVVAAKLTTADLSKTKKRAKQWLAVTAVSRASRCLLPHPK
jgi:TPR repeat protein